jgi:PIN domain nuclease of toxin-antitoxin system
LAKLVERQRLGFTIPTLTWIRRSLNENNIRIADLTPEIAVESTDLQGFHRDPADQIIVATSRILGMPTADQDYPLWRWRPFLSGTREVVNRKTIQLVT